MKEYHRNLAVAFYGCKKVYDKLHHDWILRVYRWVGIPDEVIKLISNLMELWKTRLEIWSKEEKMTSRWINISWDFCKEIVIHQWYLHLRDTIMSNTAAEQGLQNGPTRKQRC